MATDDVDMLGISSSELQENTSFIPTELPFPPLTKSHIMSCSYDRWYPKFRSHTPKARIVPLPRTFTAYLRADGIILPPDTPPATSQTSPRLAATNPTIATATFVPSHQDTSTNTTTDISLDDPGLFSAHSSQPTSRSASPSSIPSTRTSTPPLSTTSVSSAGFTSSDEDEEPDPSIHWRETHAQVRAAIAELGGKVVPKLNWSAPKDATQFNAANDMACRTAGEVYLLLKASDFVSHDLDHALDGCVDWPPPPGQATSLDESIPYVLVLRKHFPLNPSLEFRAFVRGDRLIGLTQRDLNHYPFLAKLRPHLTRLILDFFDDEVRGEFADGREKNYTFDVYVPPPYRRVWIVDFNPWDRRTDPGLWSWLELLTMDGPRGSDDDEELPEDEQPRVVTLPIRPATHDTTDTAPTTVDTNASTTRESDGHEEDAVAGAEQGDDEHDSSSSSDPESLPDLPELRLVNRDDPEAYMFNSTRYSAHKLPRDVVDASRAGVGGMGEFARQWRELVEVGGRTSSSLVGAVDTDSD